MNRAQKFAHRSNCGRALRSAVLHTFFIILFTFVGFNESNLLAQPQIRFIKIDTVAVGDTLTVKKEYKDTDRHANGWTDSVTVRLASPILPSLCHNLLSPLISIN